MTAALTHVAEPTGETNANRTSDVVLFVTACHESGSHWTVHIYPDNPVTGLTTRSKKPSAAPKAISFPSIETTVSRTSVAETPAVFIKFDNKSHTNIKIIWLDFSGEEKLYQSLGPSESYVQPTYSGHVWLVRTEGGTEVCRYAATADSKLFDVSIVE